jgi:hypothetical protein
MFCQCGGVNRRHVMVVHVDAAELGRRLRSHDSCRSCNRNGRTEPERCDTASEEVSPRRKPGRCCLTTACAGAEKPMARGLLFARHLF